MEDDEFLDALYEGALSSLRATTPLNLNSAVTMLRGHGRPDEADDIIEKYLEEMSDKGPEFFNLANHPLADDPVDTGLRTAFESKRRD